MLNIQSVGPSAALRPFVRVYAQRVVEGIQDEPAVCMPRVETLLKFEFGTPLEVTTSANQVLASPNNVVVGAFEGFSVRERLRPGLESFIVFFRPSAFTRLFGLPMVLATNVAHDGEGVVGRELRELRQRLGEASSFAERVMCVERLLMERVARMAMQSPMLDAADRILRARGTIRIASAAQFYGCTPRNFERQFVRQTGFSPKTYARVARFQCALDLKLLDPMRSWISIAHELQFHDQMHLVHEFQKIVGCGPTQALSLLGGSRLVDSHPEPSPPQLSCER
jgi:AraC-like DNA-binding protein